MFWLDNMVLQFLYEKCYQLGSIFSLGAFEGAVLYLGTISAGVFTVINGRKRAVKK